MLRTCLKEKIIDITLGQTIKLNTGEKVNGASCQIAGKSGYVFVPYSAIEWISKDWID